MSASHSSTRKQRLLRAQHFDLCRLGGDRGGIVHTERVNQMGLPLGGEGSPLEISSIGRRNASWLGSGSRSRVVGVRSTEGGDVDASPPSLLRPGDQTRAGAGRSGEGRQGQVSTGRVVPTIGEDAALRRSGAVGDPGLPGHPRSAMGGDLDEEREPLRRLEAGQPARVHHLVDLGDDRLAVRSARLPPDLGGTVEVPLPG